MSCPPEPTLVDDEVPAVHLLDGGRVLVLELVEQEPPQDGGLAHPLCAHHHQLCPVLLPKHDWWQELSTLLERGGRSGRNFDPRGLLFTRPLLPLQHNLG